MEPTLMTGGLMGEWLYVNPFETPKIGDIIAFNCLNDCGLSNRDRVSHRLTAIAPNGCMTIIGDNPKYDWSTIPCYMPENIEILGVVHKL